MPYIKVDTISLNIYSDMLQESYSNTARIKRQFSAIGNALDWDIKAVSNIRNRIAAIENELDIESKSLQKMNSFFESARTQYINADNQNIDSARKISSFTKQVSAVTFNNPFTYFDVKSLVKDSIKGAGTIYSAYKAGFYSSGFNVKQIGDYAIIYGKRSTWINLKDSLVENIKGRRYKVGSEAYISSGVGAFNKSADWLSRLKSATATNFKNFGKDTFGIINSSKNLNVGALVGYAMIAVDTVSNIVGNVQNGASTAKIAADATTDVAKGLGSMAVVSVGAKVGAAIGSFIPIPVVGTVVGGVIGGAVAGFAYKYIVDGGIQIGGKSIAGWVSTGLEKAYTAVGDAVKGAATAVKDTVVTIAKKTTEIVGQVTSTIADAAKSIGNAISGAAKSVGNFFGRLFG